MVKTVEQIATALHLSITTIRLVLNGKAEQYRISAKTQERIHNYVAEFGYKVNHTARSLKLNKTDTLGLIVPRLSNLFFSTLAEKLEIRCRDAGYQLMIGCTYSDARHENKLVEALLQRNVDGLFVVPSSLQSQNHHAKLVERRPLVLLDRDFGETGVALVVSDNCQGAEQLTRVMMAANGSAPLYFLAGDTEQPAIKMRLQGYRRVMGENPGQWILEAGHNRQEDGSLMMRQFFQRHHRAPQGFIASSLPILEGALSVLREQYGYIPAEINIGTFDEHAMLGFLSNNVWSMRQNEDAWAEHAFTAMQTALSGEAPPSGKVMIPMTMIHRQRAFAGE
ncbi:MULTISPECIES: LacI family DNA-binding transcriptional regulator [Sodalis]|jgi:LacI family fructose operon transcriptional repressor|uniref:LacI family fructose operon transcriptional repressor n=1 Tax=Sodalis ligni TaxID=2697027 RepID=A0A4R1NCP2_9GAMM|nr:LacI family DNA-binding transcriptional regulator [Sodalis ligni]TCL03371.1 LacI family fructose operon transcriptional repressor [Sodalis ligni]